MNRILTILAIAAAAVTTASALEVTLPAAGTLKEYITPEQQETVTSLKVNGDINGDDLRIIRHMIGARVTNPNIYNVEVDSGACRYLDLSVARIVRGGSYTLNYISQPKEGPPYYSLGIEVKSDTIDYLMFCGSKIKRLILPESVNYIGNTVVTWAGELYDFPDFYPFITHCINGSNLRSVTLPTQLEEFRVCGMGKIIKHRDEGPDYYAEILQTNLFDSPKLEEIRIDPENPYFKVVDGALYNGDLSELLLCPARRNKDLILPEDTKRIGDRACNNASFPSVLSISAEDVGMEAFRSASIEDELIITSDVNTIGFAAFYGCNVPKITILGNPEFEKKPFYVRTCSYITGDDINEPEFIYTENDFSLAFASNANLESLQIPNMSKVERGLFYGSALNRLNLMELGNVLRYDEYSFYDCNIADFVLSVQYGTLGTPTKSVFYKQDTSKPRRIYVPEKAIIPSASATPNDEIYLWISDESIDYLTMSEFNWAWFGVNYVYKPGVSGYDGYYTGKNPEQKPGSGHLYRPKGMRLKALECMEALKHNDRARYNSNLFAFIPYENWIEIEMGEFPQVDITGVNGVSTSKKAVEIARYDISGRLISKPANGVNIVRYSDGTVKKVFIQ